MIDYSELYVDAITTYLTSFLDEHQTGIVTVTWDALTVYLEQDGIKFAIRFNGYTSKSVGDTKRSISLTKEVMNATTHQTGQVLTFHPTMPSGMVLDMYLQETGVFEQQELNIGLPLEEMLHAIEVEGYTNAGQLTGYAHTLLKEVENGDFIIGEGGENQYLETGYISYLSQAYEVLDLSEREDQYKCMIEAVRECITDALRANKAGFNGEYVFELGSFYGDD